MKGNRQFFKMRGNWKKNIWEGKCTTPTLSNKNI